MQLHWQDFQTAENLERAKSEYGEILIVLGNKFREGLNCIGSALGRSVAADFQLLFRRFWTFLAAYCVHKDKCSP